jgi:hypothetical protein
MGFGSGGGSSSIASGTDVTLNNPASNQVLSYDTTIAKWKNQTPTKAIIGLANVDNTSDLAKPISTATLTALNATVKSSNGTVLNDIVLSQAAYTSLVNAGTTVSTTRYTIVG